MKLSTLGWCLYVWVAGGAHLKNRYWYPTVDSQFLSAYIETLIFTNITDGHPDADCIRSFSGSCAHNKWMHRITASSMATIERDCRLFCAAAGDLIASDPAKAARDFWYTRNRQGCGFWDGDWAWTPEPGWDGFLHFNSANFTTAGEQLTQLAAAFGECDVDLGRWVWVGDTCWDDRPEAFAKKVAEAELEIIANRLKA